MLLGVLSECQSLVSLKVSWLIDNTITLPTNVKPPPPPNAQEDAVMAMAQSFPPRPKPPTPTSLFARIKKTLKLAPTGPRPGSNGVPSPFSTVRPDRPSADLHGREPWRKFVVYPTTATTTSQETDADNPNLFTEAEDLILRRSTISLNPYPFLRRIHLSKIATSTTTALDNTPTGQEILFRNSPCLEDLTWNCGYILPKQLLACLDAITDTCHFIKSLELISFCPISKNNDTLRRFFQHHRPELRTLKLQQCKGIEFAISLIPPATLAGLERVSFENTLYSHPILHKFMTHAKNLQHFTWKVGAEPQYHLMPHMQTPTALPENQRISAFLEPWACYGTMRHIEQSHAIVDQDSFEAFYQQRLTQMEQLVSLVVSIKDIRRSMETSKEGPSKSLNVEECGDAPQSHCAQPSSSIDRIQNLQQLNPSSTGSPQEKEHDKDSSQGKAERGLGWHFSTIQEVILDAIGINNVSYLPDTRQLALDEIKYLLAAFPKLRKILYRGRLYPLDNEARKFLEELESRRILVAHVAQIAPAL
ncbi:hypothetical protein EC991_002989 [Linnemannia zychae]|nr:hypothetical protein EC991_002989 [Linnemannia zychae]